MNVTEDSRLVEEVQRAIQQTNALARWTTGIITALFIIMVGWMWQITNISHEMQRSLDRDALISEGQEKDIVHLRGHADRAEEAEAKLDQALLDIKSRLTHLEEVTTQTGKFTAKDGELIAERIRINSDRITALEQWKLRVESGDTKRTK